ncbi:MAG TPA: hypothetical protein VFD29_12030 [Gillisia sp.]|nr:hypothetical protein [Gillisia sp.]
MVSACSQVGITGRENSFKNKTFVHPYFETEKECIASQPEPDFFYNCHQQLDFLKDKKVQIMLSDILWNGEYKLEGNTIILTFEPNSEIPDAEIIFEILNPSKLLKTDDQTIWKKMNGNSIWN